MSTNRIDFSNIEDRNLPTLLYCSYSKYENDWVSVMHSHSFSEFLFVDSGEGEIKTREENFSIKSGDFVVIPPGLLHTESSDEKEKLSYYVLGISNTGLKDSDNINPIFNIGMDKSKIKECIRNIYIALFNKMGGYQIEVQNNFYTMLSILMKKSSFPLTIKEEKEEKGRFISVKDYLDIHYMENISLDGLSEKFYISKYHLIREFKHSFGLTPIEYLEKRRVKEAKYLLSNTEMDMTNISRSLGFSSSSYFSERFKKITNITPTEYRKQNYEK